MANRLTQKRRKCIKTQNIFRDRQEYSSLYTISSRSIVSIPSTEMMSSRSVVPNQSNQNPFYRRLHHKGDFIENVQGQNYNYPKLPNDVSMELQQKVYSNSQKRQYNERNQFTNSRSGNFYLKNDNNKPQYPKPYCPMHISAARYSVSQSPPKVAINRLEESYWATWKPKNTDAVDSKENYNDSPLRNYQSVPPHCVTNNMMAQQYVNMFSQSKTRSIQRPKFRYGDNKLFQIIREPSEMHESNSSDVGAVMKSKPKTSKSKCSCCTCPTKNGNDSDDEKSSKTKTEYDEELNSETQVPESSQEENENLYSDGLMGSETELMNWISEYEVRREHEEMQEMERQIANQNLRREEETQYVELDTEHTNRKISIRYQDEIEIKEINSHQTIVPIEQGQPESFSPRESIRSIESDEQKKILKQSLNNSLNAQPRGKSISPTQSLRNSPYILEKEGRINPKQSLRNSSNIQQKQVPDSPKSYSRNPSNDRQENEAIGPKQSIRSPQKTEPASPIYSPRNSSSNQPKNEVNSARQSPRNLNNQHKEESSSPRQLSRNSMNVQQNEEPISSKQSPRSPPNEQQQKESNGIKQSSRNSSVEHVELVSPKEQRLSGLIEEREKPRGSSSLEVSSPTTLQRRFMNHESDENDGVEEDEKKKKLRLENVPDSEVTPHLTSSAERQRQDRPRKPQPKFLKLTRTTFNPPPVKGHTYPLKSVLKKEKPPTQPIGFGRGLSPVTGKIRPPSKQNLPAYLLRHL
ncbi:hypothetical protein Trydic_g7085 [Trypoxylus dichotomus]